MFNVGSIVGELFLKDQFSGTLKKATDESTKSSAQLQRSLAAVSAAAVAMGAAMLAAAKATANYRDETTKAARRAGMTVEEFSQLRHAAELSGIQFNELAISMSKLASPEAGKRLERLGITMTNLDGTAKSNADIFDEVADKVAQAGTASEKTRIAVAAFGEEGSKMVSMLENGSAGLAIMRQEAVDLGIAFDEEAGKQAELFNDNLDRLNKSMQGVRDSLGQAVIEFINTSGVVEAATNAISGLAKQFNSLDDDTKETIVTIGAIIVALGALMAGMIAFQFMAPAIGAAFSAAFGPVGIAIFAVTTAVIALTAAIATSKTETDKLISSTLKTERAMRSASAGIERLAQMNKESAEYAELHTDTMQTLREEAATYNIEVKNTNLSLEEMRDLQRQIREEARKALESQQFNIQNQLLQLTESFETNSSLQREAVMQLRQAIASNNQDSLAEATERLNRVYQRNTKESTQMLEGLASRFEFTQGLLSQERVMLNLAQQQLVINRRLASSNEEVTKTTKDRIIATDNLEKEIKGIAKSTKDVQNDLVDMDKVLGGRIADPKWWEGILNSLDKVSKAIGSKIVDSLKDFASEYVDTLGAIAEATQAQASRTSEIISTVADLQLQNMQKLHEAEIRAVEEAEAAKIAAVQEGSIERMALINEEFAKRKAQLEDELQNTIEQERAKYEIKLQQLQAESADQEQARLARAVMEADWAAYVERLKQKHNEKLLDEEKSTQAEIRNEEQSTSDKVAQIKEDSNQKKEDLNKKQQEQEKQHSKQLAIIQYGIELFAYEAEKRAAIAGAGFQLASALMSAVKGGAELAALFPPFTIPLGIAFATMMSGMAITQYNASIATINAQKPLPPPAVFAEQGGVLQGARHAQGGVNVNAEGGEAILSRDLTSRMERMVQRDEEASRSGVMIGQGAIVIYNYGTMDDAAVDKISSQVAERIEQRRF